MEKGSSSSAAFGGAESLNGLKFGKKIYFEDIGSSLEGKSGGGQAALSASPAKKGRSGGVQRPRCQVEGCNVDLSDVKAYYARHKVCCMHSKAARATVAGIEQRFCQQCSRFHIMSEFDNGKRSCRKRLACHNERRRKPQPGSLMSPRYGSLSPTTSLSPTMFDNQNKSGGFVMDFSNYPTFNGRDSWPNATSERGVGNHQLPWPTNSQSPLPEFLQGSTHRPSYSGPGVSAAEYYGGASDSSHALSLLSIQPWGSRSRPPNLGVNNFLGTNTNANSATLVQPSVNPGAGLGQFASPSWGFKGSQGNNTLHEIPPDLGLGQFTPQHNSGQYTGELGLGQPSEARFHGLDHSRGYDSFV